MEYCLPLTVTSTFVAVAGMFPCMLWAVQSENKQVGSKNQPQSKFIKSVSKGLRSQQCNTSIYAETVYILNYKRNWRGDVSVYFQCLSMIRQLHKSGHYVMPNRKLTFVQLCTYIWASTREFSKVPSWFTYTGSIRCDVLWVNFARAFLCISKKGALVYMGT